MLTIDGAAIVGVGDDLITVADFVTEHEQQATPRGATPYVVTS